MGEPLRDPPLVESLCELRFSPDSPWDDGVVYRICEALRPRYPMPAKGGLSAAIAHRFEEQDRSGVVQIGPQTLVVNQTRAYRRWEEFRTRLDEAFATYRGANPAAKPQEFVLMTNNLFTQEKDGLDLGRILRHPPNLLPGVAGAPNIGFQTRQDFAVEDPPGVLMCTAGYGEADGVGRGLLLTLEVVSTAELSWDSLMPSLDSAHERLFEGFVAMLTDKEYIRRKDGAP